LSASDLATIDFGLRALLTLFVVIDPPGLVPVFIAHAGHRSAATQASIARRAVVIAGFVLLAFAVVGGPLLGYLGISVEALQIAGGILLFRIAVSMVFGEFRRETPEEEAEARTKEDISVFPLAIPLIAGPGALASVVILGIEAQADVGRSGIVLAAIAVVLMVAFLTLRTAPRIARILGTTGINVVTRVLGLVLAGLAVQYVANGLIGLDLFGRG
jgi:MarC family membrane protein